MVFPSQIAPVSALSPASPETPTQCAVGLIQPVTGLSHHNYVKSLCSFVENNAISFNDTGDSAFIQEALPHFIAVATMGYNVMCAESIDETIQAYRAYR
jgi:hypothetical protein